MDVVALEIIKAFGRLWLHPLTYIFILAALWFGFRRVKQERKDFHTRVYDYIHDLTFPLLVSLGFALGLSVIIVGIGIEIPFSMMMLLGILWVIFLPFLNGRWLSMTLVGSVALLLSIFLPDGGTSYAWLNAALQDLQSMNHAGFAWLLVVLLLGESLLVLSNGWKKTSPMLMTSSRGKTVGGHKVNRLWFLPLFVLLPAGPVSFEGWWPMFQSAETTGSAFMVVPFVLGFQSIVKSELPVESVKNIGNRLLILVVITAMIAAAAMVWTFLVPVIAAVIIIGREIIFFLHKSKEKKTNLFVPNTRGLTVLGVLPNTTAAKMEIEVGETITKVNGWEVETQRDLYEALQRNSAYCKLEVVDHDGQLRFAHSSIFEGDHFQIGLLFVPDDGGESNLTARGLRSSVVIHHDRNGVNGRISSEKSSEAPEHEVAEAANQDVAEQKSDFVSANRYDPAAPTAAERNRNTIVEDDVPEEVEWSMEETAATSNSEPTHVEVDSHHAEEAVVDSRLVVRDSTVDDDMDVTQSAEVVHETKVTHEFEVNNDTNEEQESDVKYGATGSQSSEIANDAENTMVDQELDPDKYEELERRERRPESGNLPYGQAAGLSAFYEEFRKSQPERNKWRPKEDTDDKNNE